MGCVLPVSTHHSPDSFKCPSYTYTSSFGTNYLLPYSPFFLNPSKKIKPFSLLITHKIPNKVLPSSQPRTPTFSSPNQTHGVSTRSSSIDPAHAYVHVCTRMKSLSGVGLGLSLVFGCLLLALIAEIYYLLWWKNRTIHKIPHSNNVNENSNGTQIHIRGQISQILTTCCKKPTSSLSTPTPHHLCSSPTTILVHDPQSSHPHQNKASKNPIEALPRFLFTITEETMEDLEQSEDGFVVRSNIRNRQSTHLGDLLQVLETPFLTPIGSPAYYTPPLTPTVWISSSGNSHENDRQRFTGQFFEAEREKDAAFNRMRASPPPKFKFLRDAEEKMIQRRRLMEQQGQDLHLNNGF